MPVLLKFLIGICMGLIAGLFIGFSVQGGSQSHVPLFFLQALQQLDGLTAEAQAPEPEVYSKELLLAPLQYTRGDSNASTYIVQYGSLVEPYADLQVQVVKQLQSTFPGQLYWIKRPYPVDSIAESQEWAELNACLLHLKGQEASWDFLLESLHNGELTLSTLEIIAPRFGLDPVEWFNCVENGQYRHPVTSTKQRALEDWNVTVSPTTFVINTTTNQLYRLEGAYGYTFFKNLLEREGFVNAL
jgi:hypothetical protein